MPKNLELKIIYEIFFVNHPNPMERVRVTNATNNVSSCSERL